MIAGLFIIILILDVLLIYVDSVLKAKMDELDIIRYEMKRKLEDNIEETETIYDS